MRLFKGLAVAGIPGKETEVHISRVDQDEIWPDDEADGGGQYITLDFLI